jgi:hypothetical protein
MINMRSRADAMNFKIPFERFIQRPIFQLAAFALGLYLIALAVSLGNAFNSYGLFQAKYFRMNLSTQGGLDLRSIRSASEILDVAFLRSGCNLSTQPNITAIGPWASDHMELAISLPHLATFDGLSLTTTSKLNCDKIRFKMLGSPDGSSDWAPVSASSFHRRPAGVHFTDSFVPCGPLSLDYRPPWPLACVGALQAALQALLCFAFCACGAARHPRLGALAFAATLALLAAAAFAAGAGYAAAGAAGESVTPLFQSAGYLAIAAVLCRAQERLVEAATAWSCALVAVRAAANCAAAADCQALVADFPVLPAVCAVLGAAFLAARAARVRAAEAAARPDRDALDALWAEAAPAAAASAAELAHLRQLARRLQAECAAGPPPRQCNRLRLLQSAGPRPGPVDGGPGVGSSMGMIGFNRLSMRADGERATGRHRERDRVCETERGGEGGGGGPGSERERDREGNRGERGGDVYI